ncbi:TPA: AI-2E family transporter [Candidatus Galligastranaerophilus faecipullorum]|nr:AI-2E family transporter [Candidatus Galligastranaerophilus faecipullorum]
MPYLDRYLTLKNIVVFFVLILIMVLAGNIADILLMLFAAYVLTCAINPIVAKLQKYMPRVLAVSLLLLLLLVGVLGFLIPLFAITVKQAIVAVENFPNYIDNIKDVLNFNIFGFSLAKIINTEALKVDTSALVSNVFAHSIEAGKMVANSFTTVLAVAIMIFYLAYDETHIRNAFIAFFPEKYKTRAGEIVDTISNRVGGYVFGQILSMAFVGFLTMIGLLLIGHKHALILGFVTFILDIVPVIGPTIAVAAGLISAAGHGFLFVLLTFAIFMLVQWLENQILRPVIFGKLMDMHPLTIIISLLVGARFLGFWGVILGPAIASVICVLVDELYLKRINNQAEAKE